MQVVSYAPENRPISRIPCIFRFSKLIVLYLSFFQKMTSVSYNVYLIKHTECSIWFIRYSRFQTLVVYLIFFQNLTSLVSYLYLIFPFKMTSFVSCVSCLITLGALTISNNCVVKSPG